MLAPMMVFLLFDCKVNEQSTRPSTLLTPIVSLGVPNIILSCNNSLKGLTELTKSYYTHGTVYYSERLEIKICQRKRCMEQNTEECCFQLSLSCGVMKSAKFPDNEAWQYVWSICNETRWPMPWCPVFIRAQTCGYCWLLTWLTFSL